MVKFSRHCPLCNSQQLTRPPLTRALPLRGQRPKQALAQATTGRHLKPFMKIGCPCGGVVYDQTDNLPDKAYLIPDQERFATLDAMDVVIDDVIAKRADADTAYIAIRRILGEAARHVYQCRACGRLFVDDRERQLHAFTLKSGDTGKEILKCQNGDNQ
jgi:hypothetical protein